MAMPTTTVQGKVILPDGTAATAGTISFELSEPGKANDGTYDNRIGGKFETDIASDGSVDFTLVPNDVITRDGQGSPGGTYYQVTFLVTSPYRSEWSENWEVDTTPDPVDIGAITRT